ncbi:RHS repeat-associated core domain-containing protein [Massilia sp. S19_KUP03_FR1]|uniref:RHS repeat-associated core domain-containing protein n=1 Tax=Massilia sp. S19_KUP03_FR1 TaxID=3025503 RepID=UPI002FCDD42E
MTDTLNRPKWSWTSSPFGNNLAVEDPIGVGRFSYGLRFPGQYFDVESGLHYNLHRDYDPDTGRFVQSDVIGIQGGLNTYAYASSNPLSMVDPSGLSGCKIAGFFIVCSNAPPPVIDGDNSFPTTTSLPWPNLKNPFDGMFSVQRPKRMTPDQESVFDRVCVKSEDPCRALKEEARKVIDAARVKKNEMLVDDKEMFGTIKWTNHVDGLAGRIKSINAILSLGQLMGCDMSQEFLMSTEIWIPNRPFPK